MIVDAFKREREHVAQLAAKYKIRIEYDAPFDYFNHPLRGRDLTIMAYAKGDSREVHVSEINSEQAYFTALHEIGHHAAKYGDLPRNLFSYFSSEGRQKVLLSELAANGFAIRNSLLPFDGTELVSYSWETYLKDWEDDLAQLPPYYRRIAKKIADEKL